MSDRLTYVEIYMKSTGRTSPIANPNGAILEKVTFWLTGVKHHQFSHNKPTLTKKHTHSTRDDQFDNFLSGDPQQNPIQQ